MLKKLKSELAALDRKITAELVPKHDENDALRISRKNPSSPKRKSKLKRQ
ncbi:MAG: hypothetical protein K2K25_04610 [Muribaculaceae bacterium]|nr:hypothetical protein [Muribaculaceae bacterium]